MKSVLCSEGSTCLSLIKDLSLFHFRELCLQDHEKVPLIQYFWLNGCKYLRFSAE